MNKGQAYELEIAVVLQNEINSGDLGLNPSMAKVIRKPTYFSPDRGKNIIFDISVELQRSGASSPYWIWVWECKNYNHTVPVDDVEEFHAKLEQIGADKTKGTIITPIGFDEGAFRYAKSKGIGLCRYIPQGSIVRLLEEEPSKYIINETVIQALTIPDTIKFRSLSDLYAISTKGQNNIDLKKLIRDELQDMV